ncbi:hypothetical protein OAK65_04560 [Synechococcus sp. AH-551-N17]|nr:hypothetical protein [Synechococcus sp. AH-551-N17]
MNSSQASPKRLEVISEAYQSTIKLIVRSFSTELAAFSTGFGRDRGSLLRVCGFSNLASIELDTILQAVLGLKKLLHDPRNPLGWNDSHQGFSLVHLIASALTATPSMCLSRCHAPLRFSPTP